MMTAGCEAVGTRGEIIVVGLPNAGTMLPAGWLGSPVLLATSPEDFCGQRLVLSSVAASLEPWQVTPLQAPGADDSESLAVALRHALGQGMRVLYLTVGDPWRDDVVRRLVSALVEAAPDATAAVGGPPFALNVVDPASGPLQIAETPLDRLMAIMRRLLSGDGCPWDREQTHASLRQYIIEEAAEVVEAIDRRQTAKLVDELGDVLLQVAFHASLGEVAGTFRMRDIAAAIETKMIYRHPHVFADWQVAGSQDVLANWEVLKAREANTEPPTPEGEHWRPLRKAAVGVCLAALDTAFAAARGDQPGAAALDAELERRLAVLRGLIAGTAGL